MLHKIDYLSFSVIMNPSKMEDDRHAPAELVRNLGNLNPKLADWLNLGDDFTPGRGRSPYSTSWLRKDHGITVFTHPDLEHALIEVTGRGCDRLEAQSNLWDVLEAVQTRLTRIDIACDIATETTPMEFAKAGYSGRFKSSSFVDYPSGSSFYVGSSKSDRYAIVYRYNEPHERSALLRVEHRIKAENAKLLAGSILEEGLSSVVSALGLAFGWCHADWKISNNAAELAVYRPERKEGKTLYWLNDTIAPLLVRLHGEGVIDVWQWVNENIAPKLRSVEALSKSN